MKTRFTHRVALGILGLAILTAPAMAETKLRMLVGWTPVNAFIPKIADVFIKKVSEIGKGTVSVSRVGPEAVPPFEQLQPVSSGVFDLLYTVGAYHQASTGIGMAFDVLKNDPAERRRTGVFEWIDKYYQRKFNLKVISIMPHPGYQMLLLKPVGADGGLKGRKIRSIPVYDGIIRALGGTPVSMPPTQVVSALQKGVIDGTAFPTMFAYGYKFHEFTKFIGRPSFGNSNTFFLANLDKYKALSDADRNVIDEAGKWMEPYGWTIGQELERDDLAGMLAHGATLTQFTVASQTQMELLFNNAVIETASKSSADDVKEFIAFAESKGMLKPLK